MEPELRRLVRRKQSNGRGYGPSDFEKFDRYSACAGYRQLGEVKVTIRIDLDESKWGLIDTNTPGAIIYMNISFTQPEDCKLETATILVTLESLDETRDKGELDALKRQPGLFPLIPSRLGLTHFGPVYVPGRETETEVSRNINATPSVSYGGFSVSGLEASQQKTYKYYNRWAFSGQLLGDDKHSAFKKLQWFLQENKIDAPANHGPEFKAAFALTHEQRPFFIRVEINGKLEKTRERAKQRFRKLKYGLYGDMSLRSTLMLVNVAESELPRRHLILEAKNLPGKMAERNGVVDVASKPEMEEEDDTGSPQRIKEIPTKKSSRKAPRNTLDVSKMEQVYASLSATASSLDQPWMSSTTLVDDNDQDDQDENEDETAANSEQEEPGKKKKDDRDVEDLNFLFILRLFFRYLFLRTGFAASKKPTIRTTLTVPEDPIRSHLSSGTDS
ncbi:hypothetical protein SAMD00023353_0503270 [Rosellinia necatrix]|uniref:Uncharacterized protein n=1 Tax=Rosellinia necatrix TaxID=77044 RepID=A0A1S7UKT7_ROSNE|nr:hypothetical protein SAMD00023353_0503270 [Rosellinia necatrix]